MNDVFFFFPRGGRQSGIAQVQDKAGYRIVDRRDDGDGDSGRVLGFHLNRFVHLHSVHPFKTP